MSFVKTKSKDETSPAKAKSTSASKEDVVGELPANRNSRLSRTGTRRFLYFDNKTLSKIKLL